MTSLKHEENEWLTSGEKKLQSNSNEITVLRRLLKTHTVILKTSASMRGGMRGAPWVFLHDFLT